MNNNIDNGVSHINKDVGYIYFNCST